MRNRISRELARALRAKAPVVGIGALTGHDVTEGLSGGGGAPSTRGRPRLIPAAGMAPDVPAKAKVSAKVKTPEAVDVHVGARIRMQRTLRGMSQEKLGDALGITFQQIQKYEKGRNRVGSSRLQAIANALGVPVAFFFEGGPGASAAEAPASGNGDLLAMLGTAEGLQLAKAFGRISDAKVRRNLVNLVRSLAEPAND